MADIVVKTVKKLSKTLAIKDIALSGGVFQNKFLKTEIIKQLKNLDFNAYTNIKTAVNDLNISLGQYYVSCRTGKN